MHHDGYFSFYMISSHLNENISSLDFALKTNYCQTSVQRKVMFSSHSEKLILAVADLRGCEGRPPGSQILSISCSFWENLAKSYVGAHPGELVPPPRGKSWIRHCLGIAKTNKDSK